MLDTVQIIQIVYYSCTAMGVKVNQILYVFLIEKTFISRTIVYTFFVYLEPRLHVVLNLSWNPR